jgi:DtxR family Mn-dependent transcriptional regulator
MFPSATVENYLKAIHHAQSVLTDEKALVPMGQLSSALGVVPGTATTMVKTLAESGLVEYEPYAGVRLTASGHKLAALVLRRHRLVELFLVQVMGMSWTEVHDEAEQMEHAVSDRLIDRMDDMLGRPAVDPHGDPIPDHEGVIQAPDTFSLLMCPLGQPLVVSRITDQDADFLRFVEQSNLKPGQRITIESRDTAADRVVVRVADERSIALGTRAASKLLVEKPTA